MLQAGYRVEDICAMGRWQSLAPARLYLERGRDFLIQFAAGRLTPQILRIDRVASIGVCVWELDEYKSAAQAFQHLD